MDYPRDQSKFSSKELELHNMLLRQIFYKISRTMTQNLLQQVMMTDMSTGVANQDYLMHFAGGLIASGQIANYNIIFLMYIILNMSIKCFLMSRVILSCVIMPSISKI
jgi:hypothetical protein